MKNDIEALKKEIDVLRETMQEIAIKKNFHFSDGEVVAASARLDKVLNQYSACRYGKQSRARGGTRGRSLYP